MTTELESTKNTKKVSLIFFTDFIPKMNILELLLASAYAKKNNIAYAELASAQAYFFEGKLSLAKNQAIRAKRKLKKGSPQWLQADDITSFQPRR